MPGRAHWRCTLRSLYRTPLLLGMLLAATIDGRLRHALGLVHTGREGAIWIHHWCRRIVEAIGIRAQVRGDLPRGGAVVCNHLSYLDILLMSATQPCVMVAKREVMAWPLLGWLTAQAGTVYVERGGGPATYPAVNAAMREAYATGLPVVFFPEGTTTDGSGVLPFRRGLFHSVLNEEAPLRTAAVGYAMESTASGAGSVADDVCWWGDTLFAPHLVRLLGLDRISATLRFGEEVRDRRDRFVLSEAAHEAVTELYACVKESTECGAELGQFLKFSGERSAQRCSYIQCARVVEHFACDRDLSIGRDGES